jgi:mannose-6-phosphate isomerase-like protein (cupin superfamily)
MPDFETKHLPSTRDAIAPDGSDVRVLLQLRGGGLAHFELPPDATSMAVCHRTVEEIWYVLSGSGEMWRKQNQHEEIVGLEPGVSLTIPLGTCFQFRSLGPDPLRVIDVTMPPWPGDHEAFEVPGKWASTVTRGA